MKNFNYFYDKDNEEYIWYIDKFNLQNNSPSKQKYT